VTCSLNFYDFSLDQITGHANDEAFEKNWRVKRRAVYRSLIKGTPTKSPKLKVRRKMVWR
jgi:hypothetical protein